MSKYLKYYGEFLNISDVRWRVEIHIDSDTELLQEEIFFPAENPLVIEWPSTDKYEPVQSSNATLKLISKEDRQFVWLSRLKAGAVRMDVLKSGNLYWSGTLDTELYEEPYSFRKDYEVELTFSDFAILDRIPFNMSGFHWPSYIIYEIVINAGFRHSGITNAVSTKPEGAIDTNILDVYLNTENFYDEDGEAMTMRGVLKAILQPFTLRIIQREGHVYVYDLVYMLKNKKKAKQIVWNGTDAILSTDKIYNDISVNFSPYGDAVLLDGKIELAEDPNPSDNKNILVRLDYSATGENTLSGFRFYYGLDASGLELSDGAQYCKIEPLYSGNEASAVLWGMRHGDVPVIKATLEGQTPGMPLFYWPELNLLPTTQGTVFKCPLKYISRRYSLKDMRSVNEELKVSLDLLLDVRYNPFESAGKYNEKDNYKDMRAWCNLGYVPIILNFLDSSKKAIAHYENKMMMEGEGYSDRTHKCVWVDGPGKPGDAWLAYYDVEDRRSDTGFGGWKTNKNIIGFYQDKLPESFSKIGDGEHIPLPTFEYNQSGYIELQVLAGIVQLDYGREIKNIYKNIRWLAYKEPKILLVDKANGKEIRDKDIEYKAHLNENAKEGLLIDTIIGTSPSALPTAKGLIWNEDREILTMFERNGITDSLEHLLIGTIYSQYTAGNNILSGTSKIMAGLDVITDAHSDACYIMKSDVQDLVSDETQLELVELSEENYKGIEYA